MADQIPVTQTDQAPSLSVAVVSLLKGAVYRDADPAAWSAMVGLQAPVRDYVAVMGLDLVLDEAEGYAFLRSRPDSGEADESRLPRLIARRPLTFPVSLLLALLRKKLAELDARGGDTRLVLSRTEVIELLRVFLPEGSNEAKIVDQVDAHLNKVVDLGFLRHMKLAGDGHEPTFEVRRILKAFVDAQWLADFDQRLTAYRTLLEGDVKHD